MATESPLIHDGAQCVLGFDARNSTFSGTTNSGPSGSAQFCLVSLSTVTARMVLLPASSGARVYGVLQNKGSSSQVADVGIFGISKVVCAGSSVGIGQIVMASSGNGGACPYSSASSIYPVGIALEGATVGQVFTCALYGFGQGAAGS